MIEIALKLQPESDPREIDGLFWGASEPVEFSGLNEDGSVLIGQTGSYLLRPVCRMKDRICKVWRDGQSQFPHSVPVGIRRVDDWCDPAMLDAVADKMKTLDRTALNKAHVWIKTDADECRGNGKAPVSLDEFSKGVIGEQDKRMQAADSWRAGRREASDNPEYFWLYFSLSLEFPNWDIDELLGRIRFAVQYADGEIIYLSDLNMKPPPIGSMKKSEVDADDGTRFVLENNYRTLEDTELDRLYFFKEGTTAHRALKIFHLHTSPEDRLTAADLLELMGKEGLEPKPKKWFKHGISCSDGNSKFIETGFAHLIKNDGGLWWIEL